MPRATEVLVEPHKEVRLDGLSWHVSCNGWRLIIDRVTAVGCTYRAKLVSPEGVSYPCPTSFRKPLRCYAWAKRELKLLRSQHHESALCL